MKWGELPANQRKAVLIVWPLLVVGIFGYLCYGSLGRLGADPALESVAFLPKKKDKQNLWGQIASLQQQISAEKAEAARLPEVKKELEEVQQRMGELQARLPNQKQKEEMRLRLQEMVNEVPESVGRVQFVSVSIQEAAAAGGRRGRSLEAFTTVNYRLSLSADMNGAIWYIHRIETSPRFMSVSNVDIRPGRVHLNTATRKIEYDLHDLTLDVVTYVLHDEGGEG